MNGLGNTLLIFGKHLALFWPLILHLEQAEYAKKILLSAKLLAKLLVKIQFRADISHEISTLFCYLCSCIKTQIT